MDEKTQTELKAAIAKYEEARDDYSKQESLAAEAQDNQKAAEGRRLEASAAISAILRANGTNGVMIGPRMYQLGADGYVRVTQILQVDTEAPGPAVLEVGATA